jgi:hypothetical protein
MESARAAKWETFGGLVLTAGLATAANLLRGDAAWAFAALALALGVLILVSTSFGWPVRFLAQDDR